MRFAVKSFTPADWYWRVADATENTVWSSKAGAYIFANDVPADAFVTNIDSAASLRDVLYAYNLPYPPVPPLIAHIKAEAQRRIVVATGATDLMTCVVKQLNANMRANELNDKRVSGGVWTSEEEAQAAGLRALAVVIKRIRDRSNELEISLPVDYSDDRHWV